MPQPTYVAVTVGIDPASRITSQKYDGGSVSLDVGDVRLLSDDAEVFETIAAEAIAAANALRGVA